MKKITALILALLMIIAAIPVSAVAEDEKELKFRPNGEFRILVISDTQDDMYPAYDMINFLKMSIAESDPDLIVFCGDLVEDSRVGDIGIDGQSLREGVCVYDIKRNIKEKETFKNVRIASDAVLSILQASGIPFALAQGNNDCKVGMTNEQWLELYSQYSNCLVKDMSDDSEGRIDYNLMIKNSKGENAFNVWMFDTGRGGVKSEQIEWYKKQSAAITAENGQIVPAVAFQHIQVADIGNLFEECKINDRGARAIGAKYYRLNPDVAHGVYTFAYEPGITTAQFNAWKECGDVKGAFFGHQHTEGFSGRVDGIELGFTYGCEFAKSGPYGYRTITINEENPEKYETELYTYEGSVLKGNAHFVLQEDEIDPDFTLKDRLTAVFKKMIYLIVSFFGSI